MDNCQRWYVRFDSTGWHPARPYQVEAVLHYVSGNSSKEVRDATGAKFDVTFHVTNQGVIVYTPNDGPTQGRLVEMLLDTPAKIAYINRLTT
jgi:hypothetical protein